MIARDESRGKNGRLIWWDLCIPFLALYLSSSGFKGVQKYSLSHDEVGYYAAIFVLISLFLISMFLFYCFFQLSRTARLIRIIDDQVEVTDFFWRVSRFAITDIESLDKINMNMFLKRYFLYTDHDKHYREMTNSKICFKDGSWYFITPKMSGLDEIKESLGLKGSPKV